MDDTEARLQALELKVNHLTSKMSKHEDFIRANIGKIVSVSSVEKHIDDAKYEVIDTVNQFQHRVNELEQRISRITIKCHETFSLVFENLDKLKVDITLLIRRLESMIDEN